MNAIRQTIKQASLKGTVEGDWRAFRRKWVGIFERFTDEIVVEVNRVLDNAESSYEAAPYVEDRHALRTFVSPMHLSVAIVLKDGFPRSPMGVIIPGRGGLAIDNLGLLRRSAHHHVYNQKEYMRWHFFIHHGRPPPGKITSKWLSLVDQFRDEFGVFQSDVADIIWDAGRAAGMDYRALATRVVQPAGHISGFHTYVTVGVQWNQETTEEQRLVFFDYMEEHAGLRLSDIRDKGTQNPVWDIEA